MQPTLFLFCKTVFAKSGFVFYIYECLGCLLWQDVSKNVCTDVQNQKKIIMTPVRLKKGYSRLFLVWEEAKLKRRNRKFLYTVLYMIAVYHLKPNKKFNN